MTWSPILDIVWFDWFQVMHIGFLYWLLLVCFLCCCFFHRNLEFEDDQKAHQQRRLQMLRSTHQNIVDIMTGIHNIFSNDGPEVRAVFLSFVQYW